MHRARRNLVHALVVLVGLNVAFTGVREISWRVLADQLDMLASLDWLIAALGESSVWLLIAFALVLLCLPDGQVRLPGNPAKAASRVERSKFRGGGAAARRRAAPP